MLILTQAEALALGAVEHPDDYGGDLAALYAALGKEGAVRQRAVQDACAVEGVDLGGAYAAHGDVGYGAVRTEFISVYSETGRAL